MANAQALAPRLPDITQLPIQQKFGLMLAAAAVIALFVGAWLWSRTPDYRVLYTNLSERDADQRSADDQVFGGELHRLSPSSD